MSPIYSKRTDEDWADTTLVTLPAGAMFSQGNLILDPKDRSPNRNWREISEDGTPRGWNIDLPPTRVGQNAYVSRPGNRTAGVGIPDEETKAPRQNTLSRQTFPAWPLGKQFSNHKELAFGWQPESSKYRKSRLGVPGAPVVTLLASGKKGFRQDTYGLCFDLRRTKHAGRTTPSGFTFIASADFATGQGFRVYIPPEAIASGAHYMGVYVTRPGSAGLIGTEREQGSFDIRRHAAQGYVDIPGPYHNGGRRPVTKDQSGTGAPPAPLPRRRHGRAYVHKGHAPFDLHQGIYRIGYMVQKGAGISFVSELSDPFTVVGDTKQKIVKRKLPNVQRRRLAAGESPGTGEHLVVDDGVRYAVTDTDLANDEHLEVINGVRYAVREVTVNLHVQENTAIHFYFPGLPKHWKIIPVVYYRPLTGGDGIWYRVAGRFGLKGSETAYSADRLDDGIAIYGYAPGTEPSRAMDYLVDMGGRNPEDTTVLTSPSPDSGPDVDVLGIPLMDAPASYWVAATDEDEYGYESELSPRYQDPTTTLRRSVRLTTSGQGIRVLFDPPTNKLRNAEGQETAADDDVFHWHDISALNSSGTPIATNNTVAVFADGSLNYYATATPSGAILKPYTDLVPLPDEAESLDMSVKAQLRLYSVTNNTVATQVILRYHDDTAVNTDATTGQIGSDVVLLEAKATGKINLGELGRTFGASGTVFPDGATQCRIVVQGATSSWNSRGYVENLGIFYSSVAPRKFERLADDEAVLFNPTAQSVGTVAGAAVPYPPGSASAVGPVAAAEETAPATEPLIDEVTFETGAFTTGWNTLGSNNLTDTDETAAPIFGAHSRKYDDQTTNNKKQSIRRKTWTNADLTSWGGTAVTSLFVRGYDRPTKTPTKGEVLVARILDDAGTPKVMGSIWRTSSQLRLYNHKADGTKNNYTVGLSGLANNVDVDWELGITGGNTSNGSIILTAGKSGNTRTVVGRWTGRDFAGRKPRTIDVGPLETDPGAKFTTILDNVLVSKSGAPTNYEALTSPGGVTIPSPIPDPDAPPSSAGGGGFRLYDVNSNSLNQWYYYIEPSVAKAEGQDYGIYCEDVISVRAGEIITHAIPGGYYLLETPAEPSHQLFVTLYGPDVEPLEVGSPFAAGKDASAASRSGGARMNNASDVGMSTSGSIANTDDFYQIFTVPAGYLWATIGPKNGVGGIYRFQEHLFAVGNLTTQTARDAARDYGRATSATGVSVVVPAFPDPNPYRWPLNDSRVALGIRNATMTGTQSISNILYSSGPTRTGPWSTPVAEQLDVPAGAYYRFTFDMAGETGEGANYPTIEPGGLFCQIRPFMSVLLTKDRKELPGGVWLNSVDSPDLRGRGEILEIDGDVYDARRSKDVSYFTQAITGYIATEETKRFLESLYADDELTIEAPFIGADGKYYRIALASRINVNTQVQTAFIDGGVRNVYGSFQITPQVLEESPLIS